MAEDVTLPDPAALGREQVTLGDVADVHDVEPGVDDTPGALAAAKSTMISPVGVGFASHGPTGAVGLTTTTGSPRAANESATRSASTLDRL